MDQVEEIRTQSASLYAPTESLRIDAELVEDHLGELLQDTSRSRSIRGGSRRILRGLVLGSRIVGTNKIKILSTIVLDTEHSTYYSQCDWFADFEARRENVCLQ